jgi:hypothetical protein
MITSSQIGKRCRFGGAIFFDAFVPISAPFE